MTGQPTAPDELDRLFAWLVRAIRDQRPEYLAGAFEVGELLSFVPYKLVRADVGVATNDDYGHALTRLFAGERGFMAMKVQGCCVKLTVGTWLCLLGTIT